MSGRLLSSSNVGERGMSQVFIQQEADQVEAQSAGWELWFGRATSTLPTKLTGGQPSHLNMTVGKVLSVIGQN